jgi:hypothetical protein
VFDWFHHIIPATKEGVNIWCGSCILLFIFVSYIARALDGKSFRVEPGVLIAALFGGVSFGTGTLLFSTFFHPSILALMSDHELWIGTAGGCATVASFSGLLPKKP